MNGFSLFKAMNGTEEKYLREALTYAPVRKKINHSRRFVGIAAAAALLGTGTIGAVAYGAGYRIENGELVRRFYGSSAEKLIGEEAINHAETAENKHFSISVHSYLTDGKNYSAVWCIEAEDEEAAERLSALGSSNVPYVQASWSDGSIADISCEVGTDSTLNDADHYYFYTCGFFEDGFADSEVTFTVNTNGITGLSEDEIRILPEEHGVLEINTEEDNLSKGIDFTLSTTANITTEQLIGENGNVLSISQLGITCSSSGSDVPFDLTGKKPELVYSDGHREAASTYFMTQTENGWYFRMGEDGAKLLDTESITGVVIGDAEYIKQSAE